MFVDQVAVLVTEHNVFWVNVVHIPADAAKFELESLDCLATVKWRFVTKVVAKSPEDSFPLVVDKPIGEVTDDLINFDVVHLNRGELLNSMRN